MADLLHANAIQQLEVMLMGSPVTQVIDLLSEGLAQSSVATTSTLVSPPTPHPRSYASTSLAPPPTSVPVEGISTAIPASSSGVVEPAVPETKENTASDSVPCWCITPTPVELSLFASNTSLLTSPSINMFPNVVVSELAIPAEAYPKWIN